jgi:excisionase family DNA binding protein
MGNDVAGGTGTIGSEEMTDNLLDVRQVAKLLGLAPGSIYQLISQSRIPVVRLSARCVRFRRCDIDRWIAERVVDAKAINVPASGRRK